MGDADPRRGAPTGKECQPAGDLAAEKAAVQEINKSMDFVTFVPTRFFRGYRSWPKNIGGVAKAPFPVVWDVTKS